MPSAARVATLGATISAKARASSSGVSTRAGLYAPIPPVLGPVSPSPTRLWSCAVPNGTIAAPSVSTNRLTSSPVRNSSITALAPGSANSASTAAVASAGVVVTVTPLPAASPSALTTTGVPNAASAACASSGECTAR